MTTKHRDISSLLKPSLPPSNFVIWKFSSKENSCLSFDDRSPSSCVPLSALTPGGTHYTQRLQNYHPHGQWSLRRFQIACVDTRRERKSVVKFLLQPAPMLDWRSLSLSNFLLSFFWHCSFLTVIVAATTLISTEWRRSGGTIMLVLDLRCRQRWQRQQPKKQKETVGKQTDVRELPAVEFVDSGI